MFRLPAPDRSTPTIASLKPDAHGADRVGAFINLLPTVAAIGAQPDAAAGRCVVRPLSLCLAGAGVKMIRIVRIDREIPNHPLHALRQTAGKLVPAPAAVETAKDRRLSFFFAHPRGWRAVGRRQQ